MNVETGVITNVFLIGVMAGMFLAILVDWLGECIGKLIAAIRSMK